MNLPVELMLSIIEYSPLEEQSDLYKVLKIKPPCSFYRKLMIDDLKFFVGCLYCYICGDRISIKDVYYLHVGDECLDCTYKDLHGLNDYYSFSDEYEDSTDNGV
jgi:hypothetical protein